MRLQDSPQPRRVSLTWLHYSPTPPPSPDRLNPHCRCLTERSQVQIPEKSVKFCKLVSNFIRDKVWYNRIKMLATKKLLKRLLEKVPEAIIGTGYYRTILVQVKQSVRVTDSLLELLVYSTIFLPIRLEEHVTQISRIHQRRADCSNLARKPECRERKMIWRWNLKLVPQPKELKPGVRTTWWRCAKSPKMLTTFPETLWKRQGTKATFHCAIAPCNIQMFNIHVLYIIQDEVEI
ncbi:hypothetical protein J6590_039109 [Homalodisca vitripennis]|nr:hypothetical protein J6590_039109 [Homalodisca vitripennis]